LHAGENAMCPELQGKVVDVNGWTWHEDSGVGYFLAVLSMAALSDSRL
jgi:hypothetical protein